MEFDDLTNNPEQTIKNIYNFIFINQINKRSEHFKNNEILIASKR